MSIVLSFLLYLLMMTMTYNKEEGVLEIFRLSVDSKMRGRGVALKLVDKVLQVMIIMMRVRMVMMREGVKMMVMMVMVAEQM